MIEFEGSSCVGEMLRANFSVPPLLGVAARAAGLAALVAGSAPPIATAAAVPAPGASNLRRDSAVSVKSGIRASSPKVAELRLIDYRDEIAYGWYAGTYGIQVTCGWPEPLRPRAIAPTGTGRTTGRARVLAPEGASDS